MKAAMRLMVKRSRTKSQGLEKHWSKDSSSIAERRDANRSVYEMCPIYADFKHFMRPNPKNFADPRKVSSIM
jgi:hypothetical protein